MQSPLLTKNEHPIATAATLVAMSVVGLLVIVGGGFTIRIAVRTALVFIGLGEFLP